MSFLRQLGELLSDNRSSSCFLSRLWTWTVWAAEDFYTEKAMGDVKALRERNPEFALVLDPFDVSSPPPLSALIYKKAPVHLVEVGSYIFVQAGEVCVSLDCSDFPNDEVQQSWNERVLQSLKLWSV